MVIEEHFIDGKKVECKHAVPKLNKLVKVVPQKPLKTFKKSRQLSEDRLYTERIHNNNNHAYGSPTKGHLPYDFGGLKPQEGLGAHKYRQKDTVNGARGGGGNEIFNLFER